MSTSVAPAAARSGQPVELGLDPCAVVLVLMNESQVDDSRAASPGRPAPGGASGGHTLDRYA
jgi:hypothetical protein